MRWLAMVLVLVAADTSVAWAKPQLVRAAPVRGTRIQSPRRLFNSGLVEEEQGNVTRAVQFYLSARLSIRRSFADELYARGAGYRLVRILAGYDDDAAAAAAMLVSDEAESPATSDLAPLVRTLLRRLDDDGTGADLEVALGVIASVRYKPRTRQTVIEIMAEEENERRLVLAEGPVGPFSAGDPVRILVRRDRSRAYAGWRLVAVGHAEADGWQLLSVSGLPGQAGDEYGALLRQ